MSPDTDTCLPASELIGDSELAFVCRILRERRSFDISVYKDSCMKRRLALRIRSIGCDSAAEYCNLLQQNGQELAMLQHLLTIHVSHFFRNPSMYERLRQDVLPALFAAAADSGRDMQFLSLGCAGGEEPYSLAILLEEYFSREREQTWVKISAMDIDEPTIVAARQAEYGSERLKEVPAPLRERYFKLRSDRFALLPNVADMVAFHIGCITRTDQYLTSDMILCRNTLIYFTRPDQERILHGIAAALRPSGILVLGKSDALVGEARHVFEPVCLTNRIYRRS